MASVKSAIGLVALALVLVCRSPVDIGFGVFRIEPDGLIVVGNGLVDPAFPSSAAPVGIGYGIFRIEPNGFAVVSDGFVGGCLLLVGDASATVGFGQFRVEPSGLRAVRDGLVECPVLYIDIPRPQYAMASFGSSRMACENSAIALSWSPFFSYTLPRP